MTPIQTFVSRFDVKILLLFISRFAIDRIGIEKFRESWPRIRLFKAGLFAQLL